MAEFNLRHIIRGVCDNSTLVDPTDISNEVLKRIPDQLREEALHQAMRAFVRQVISEIRPVGRIAAPPKHGQLIRSKPARIREGWQRHLRYGYHTAGGWKMLGDCEYDDLIYMAEQVEKKARENIEKGKGWRGLAAAIKDNEVKIVKELPDDVLMYSLGSMDAA